jgi:hypothetical protein
LLLLLAPAAVATSGGLQTCYSSSNAVQKLVLLLLLRISICCICYSPVVKRHAIIAL